MIHKTTIEMDEGGLEATAATQLSVLDPSTAPTAIPILFKADHPFQMFIIDHNHDNLILFQGYIANPGIPIDGEVSTEWDETKNPIWSTDNIANQ